MYKRFIAPKMSELLKTEVPTTYKITAAKKQVETKKMNSESVAKKLGIKIKSKPHKKPTTHMKSTHSK